MSRSLSWLSLALMACGGSGAPSAVAEALGGELTRPFVLHEFSDGFAIHGVGSDGVLYFAVQPSEAPTRARGVHVVVPGLGSVGEVSAPPGGWGTPLTIKIESFEHFPGGTRGRFLLMDNQVPPALLGTRPTLIHRYEYRWSRRDGLSSTRLETHTLPAGILYAGSIALLPHGQVAITDNTTGALWFSIDDTLDNWAVGVVDPRFAGAFTPVINGIGRAPGGGTRAYSILTPAPPGTPPGIGLAPGSHSITYAAITDEVCWSVTTPGGIYCTPRAGLVAGGDPTAKTVRNLVAPGPDSIGTYADGCDYDRFHPTTPWLYWQPAPSNATNDNQNSLYRVHLETGAVEVVARSNTAYDWTNEISVVPVPLDGITEVLSSVGQEYNNPDVNVLLGGVSSYVAPSPMPVVLVDNRSAVR